MCRHANAFIPDKDENTIIIPENELGLQVHVREEGQKDFALKFAKQSGVIIDIDDGHCLCNYEDWPAFFHFIEQIRQDNNVKVLPILVYWSDDRYELNDSDVLDVTVDDIPKAPEEGRLINVQISVSRRLAQSLGKRITLDYKNGKTINGILELFDKEGNYGAIRTEDKKDLTYFNNKELASVTLAK